MQTTYNTENLPKIPGTQVAIIQSKWYTEYTDKMVAVCRNMLQEIGCNVECHLLPGALELPLAAKILLSRASQPKLDAIIAFGAVLKGDTYHFDMVWNGCSSGLAQVALEFGVPVINEVLAVNNLVDIEKRCADDKHNKGLEAALAAVGMISWVKGVTT